MARDSKGRFCKKHKQTGMMNVVSRCEVSGCERTQAFGPPGKSATHCSKHCQKGMVRTNAEPLPITPLPIDSYFTVYHL